MKNARLKIAWFSPLPPQRGRVSECSTRMLSGLKPYMDVDVFVENPSLHRNTPLADEFSIASFTDFQRLRSLSYYDLVLYHVANEPSCIFACLTLLDFPGVMVLHEPPSKDLILEGPSQILRADERVPGPVAEGKRAGPLYSLLQKLIDSSLGIIAGNDHLKREVLKHHPRGPVIGIDLETENVKALSDFLRLVLLSGFLGETRGGPGLKAREALVDGLAGALSDAGIELVIPDLLEGLSVVVDELIPPRRDGGK